MDIKDLTNVSRVVINSLLMVLKQNDVDVDSISMQLSASNGDYVSDEVNLGELAQQTLEKLKATPEGFVLVPSGVLDLTRFMCETWTEIDKFVYKNCQNLELYPLIQGSKTQSAIRKIGKQKFNPFSVGAGIQAMIEAQEQSHD